MNEEIKKDIDKAVEQFREMLIEQYERNERIAAEGEPAGGAGCADGEGSSCAGGKAVEARALGGGDPLGSVPAGACGGAGAAALAAARRPVVIGTAAGDGIGPVIMEETDEILRKLLAEELACGTLEMRKIEGFTLERRLELGETVPADVLEQLLACDVILKGPTTTPNVAMGGKNLESANVFLRKQLDLFANVRPVKLPEEGIDWTFFRENTEGEYALGSRGIKLGNELSVDFKVTTQEGTKRIARAAFDFARANGKKRVSIVTKANIMKKTDGDFQSICLEIAKDYPELETDCWFIDIMAANLVNKEIRNQFEVFILPNLYGDILTDEAAQIQGGVGTAGSSNIGTRHSIFEAIHGSAPRMVEDGIAHLANPASLMTASVLMLRQVAALCSDNEALEACRKKGAGERPSESIAKADISESIMAKADRLEQAIALADAKLGDRMTGLPGGASCKEFADEVRSELFKL